MRQAEDEKRSTRSHADREYRPRCRVGSGLKRAAPGNSNHLERMNSPKALACRSKAGRDRSSSSSPRTMKLRRIGVRQVVALDLERSGFGQESRREYEIDDIAGHEIRIVARQTLTTEGDDRLRHVEIDNDATAEPGRFYICDRLQVILGRQLGESTINQFARGFSVDVADDRHRQFVTCENAAHIIAQIVGGDGRDRLQRAPGLASVRMAWDAVCRQLRLAILFGLVVSRWSPAISCRRTRSTASASKRGAVKASRRRSKASSRCSLSDRSEPWNSSRPARKLSSMA